MSSQPPQTIYLYHTYAPFNEQDGIAWGTEPIPPFADVDDDIVATKYVRSDGGEAAGELKEEVALLQAENRLLKGVLNDLSGKYREEISGQNIEDILNMLAALKDETSE